MPGEKQIMQSAGDRAKLCACLAEGRQWHLLPEQVLKKCHISGLQMLLLDTDNHSCAPIRAQYVQV